MSCRNRHTWSFKGINMRKLLEQMDKDPEKRAQHNAGLEEFEKLCNNRTGRLRKGDDGFAPPPSLPPPCL